jgi:hypothetical protein
MSAWAAPRNPVMRGRGRVAAEATVVMVVAPLPAWQGAGPPAVCVAAGAERYLGMRTVSTM